MGTEGWELEEGVEMGEKNSFGIKLTLYDGRWEKGLEMGRQHGGRWERVPPIHPTIILYLFLGCRKNSMNSEVIILNIYDDGKVILISNIVSLR